MPVTSVILPVFNEARVIGRTVTRVLTFARARPDYRFIFVDDGSTDGTAQLLQDALQNASCPHVTFLRNPANSGKGYSIRRGFAQADGDYLIFTDGDLAYSLDHLASMEKALAAHDVVIGSRELRRYRPRNSSLRRQVLGWGFNLIARSLCNLPYRDTQAGLKGFRREAARRIFARNLISGFGFDVELLFLARKFGYGILEIPAEVDADHSYKTAKIKLLNDSLRMLGELARVRRNDLLGRYE